MELNEEIYRIKSLLKENSEIYKISVISDINTDRGFCVYYLTENNNVIGVVNLTNLNNVLLDETFENDVRSLHENYDQKETTAYLHSIIVEEPYRRQGYGSKLIKECENVARNSGYTKISAIVKKNNLPSQKMFKNLGYNIKESNTKKELFILDIN